MTTDAIWTGTIPDGLSSHGLVNPPPLSIMILTIPDRRQMLLGLLSELKRQDALGWFEILVHADNRVKKIGEKRQECLNAARGRYVAFLDDDDMIGPSYVNDLIEATARDVDVITFIQRAVINGGNPFLVDFSIHHPVNEPTTGRPGGVLYRDIKRRPFHMCAWNARVAKKTPIPFTNWGEDWAWCEAMLREVKTEYHIPRVLHHYVYDDKVSASGDR